MSVETPEQDVIDQDVPAPGTPAPEPLPAPALWEPDAHDFEAVHSEDEVVGADLVAEPEPSDVDRLLSEPVGPVALSTGTTVNIRRLKLREFLRLLKIITRGAGSLLQDIQLDFEDQDQFTQNLLAILLFAIPEAEQETVDFLVSMTEPTALAEKPADRVKQYEALEAELANPELEDAVEILTRVVRNEASDLRSLGKRLRVMFQTAQKLGALKTS